MAESREQSTHAHATEAVPFPVGRRDIRGRNGFDILSGRRENVAASVYRAMAKREGYAANQRAKRL